MHTIQQRFIDHCLGGLPVADALQRALIELAPMATLPGPLRPTDVPRPECIERHLPPHGQPTRDDYQRAWALCLREQASRP